MLSRTAGVPRSPPDVVPSSQPKPESKKPAYLYNVAQAYRQGGKCKDAAFFYKRYLSLKPDAPNRADVEGPSFTGTARRSSSPFRYARLRTMYSVSLISTTEPPTSLFERRTASIT